MLSSTAVFQDRLLTLAPRLKIAARSAVGTGSEYDADDLYQTIMLKLLEQNAQDPTFSQQTDQHLINFANWRARNQAHKGRIYTRYVDAEPAAIDEDGDETSLFEMLVAADEPAVEDACISRLEVERIVKAVEDLDPADRQIVYMLSQGASGKEIAAALRISAPAVCQKKARIQRQLCEAVAFA